MSNPTDQTLRALLVDEANRRYGLALEVGTVQISVPTLINASVVDLLNPGLRNTTLTISRGNPSLDGVLVNVRYNRLFVPKFVQPYSMTFVDESEEDLLAFLPRLSTRLGRTLDVSEFINVAFTQDNEVRTAVLAAQTNSLLFFGQVTITLAAVAQPDVFQTEDGQHTIDTESGIPFQIEIV